MENIYQQISDERYNILMTRYDNFVKHLDNLNHEPVKVFDPLSPNLIRELELIREASKDLQKKKEEDVKKAAQAAVQQEEEAVEQKAEQDKEVEKEDA